MELLTESNAVAIVGIGCRFPGRINTPEEFWKLLCDGIDAVTEIPKERFDIDAFFDADPSRPGKLYSRWGGFVSDVDSFDAEFFGISPREAVRIDPQQRLLLEVVWEALEDGGCAAERLAGSKTGVFIGISTHDYCDLQINPANWNRVDAYASTGTASSIAANRISYVYDFRGPSFTVDTACSSSLTAVHLACRSLREGTCDVAIAGGVNVFLTPGVAIGFCRASMLSPEGRCKAFDTSANGFVRSEGAGVVVLKPLAAAMADGDRIYAVVRGTAINQDGRTVGLMVPSADAQEALIREALRDAGVEPHAVQYVEAHGTGTRVGDPIEAAAIGRVLSKGRGPANPCLIGSVKTNIGHLEAAAGIAGVIKASLMLQHRMIPSSLHFHSANPAIPLEELRLRVVTALEPWPGNGTRALAGVNSFGFGGANAHVVLEEAPRQNAVRVLEDRESVQILPVSARHPGALRELVCRYRDILIGADAPSLRNLCYSAAVRRSHHGHRAAFVGANQVELVEQMDALLSREERDGPVTSGPGTRDQEPKLAFVFTGMGPQWWGMGRQLFETELTFREAIEECDRLFRDIGNWSLLGALRTEESDSRVQEADLAPAANLAIQVGLTKLWRSWGIVPEAIVGHSAGEIGAAWAAGALSLEDALKVAFHRGRLQYRATGSGTMLAAGVPEQEAVQLIEGLTDRVSIAAINSPTSVTFSGERRALEQIAIELARQQRFSRFLPVEVPYHAPCLEALRDEFIELLSSVAPRLPVVPLLSTVSGRWIEGAGVDADYWYANLRLPVRFAEAIDRLIQEGYDLFIEIGPHPVLAASISECLSACSKTGMVLASLRRKEEERRVLLRSLAAIYGRGQLVDWSGVCGTSRLVSLPHYPWQRDRYWYDSSSGPVAGSYRSVGMETGHPLLGCRLQTAHPCWQKDMSEPALGYLDDHRVHDRAVYPAAGYVEMALAAAREVAIDTPLSIEAIAFREALFLDPREETLLEFAYHPGESFFEVHSARKQDSPVWALNATGKLKPGHNALSVDLEAIKLRCPATVTVEEAYRSFRQRGLGYDCAFRAIAELWRGEGEALGRIGWPADEEFSAESYQVHPALLDASLQVLIAAVELPDSANDPMGGLYLPVSIERVIFHERPGSQFWSHATVHRRDDTSLEGSLELLDDGGNVAASIEGLRCKRLEPRQASQREQIDDRLYQLRWEPKPLPVRTPSHPLPLLNPLEVFEKVQPIVDRLVEEWNWVEYAKTVEPKLNAIVLAFTLTALDKLGLQDPRRLTEDVKALGESLGVVPQHFRFFATLIEIVRSSAGPASEVRFPPGSDGVSPHRLCEAMNREQPEFGVLVEMLSRCGEPLAELLRGKVDARELLFSPDALVAWERFFGKLPWYCFYNTMVAEAVQAVFEKVPAQTRLRILEIGAGTGGTTSFVLSKLQSRSIEYLFTDISAFFLAQARERFHDQPFVRCATLDIEKEPLAQLGEGSFDLVLAANAFHATADLRNTLRNAKRLLAPGGLLVFLEGARTMAWPDLIFGVTEGWWRFTDLDVRPSHPLLGEQKWRTLMEEAGFENPVGISETRMGEESAQTVVLGQAPMASRVEPGLDKTQVGGRHWLVLSDRGGIGQNLADSLRARGDHCTVVFAGREYRRHNAEVFETAPRDDNDMTCLLDDLDASEITLHGLIHLWSLDAPATNGLTAREAMEFQRVACGGLLNVIHAFEKRERTAPELWLVTAGAQPVDGARDLLSVTQAPLWGLGRVLMNEQPAVRCRLVDLSLIPSSEEVQAFIDELNSPELEEDLAFRGGKRFVTRLHRTSLGLHARRAERHLSPETASFHVEITSPGSLEGLVLKETPSVKPGPDQVLIRVLAAGLNFRDVMLALDIIPFKEAVLRFLGFECSGVVLECGEGVKEFRPGDEVIAISTGSFGSQITIRAGFAAKKPAHLTFEEAATIPCGFLTAHYGLNYLARLTAGERVLIHAGTGGVGLAAIQLAKRTGAEIFATAGSPEKRAYLKELGVAHVMDSRSLKFADEILDQTGGEGVDVVLNSLSGDAISKGLSILRPYGRFVEIGKRDIYQNTPLGMLLFNKNLSFFSLALDQLYVERPALVESLLREVVQEVAAGRLQSMPHTDFDLAEAEQALRYMAQARHIGKVVLTVRQSQYLVKSRQDEPLCRPEATYLITGGLGGFGLAVAHWMVSQGARNIVLLSRTGQPLKENEAALEALRGSGASVVLARADVGETDDLARVLDEIRRQMPPLKGVIHAAMVLNDGLLVQMDHERLRATMAPKIAGAWNLHTLTLDEELDFFVLFSSIVSILGNSAQGNYAAANAFLDALASYRHALGLPALAINWGALSAVGYVSRHEDIARYLASQGLDSFRPEEALETLGQLLHHDFTQVMASRLNWQTWGRLDPAVASVKRSKRLSNFDQAAELGPEALEHDGRRNPVLQILRGAGPENRPAILEEYIVGKVAKVLGTSPKKIDAQRLITEMGFDSLMAVELQSILRLDLGIQLGVAKLLQGISIHQLTASVLQQLTFDAAASVRATQEKAAADAFNDGAENEGGPEQASSLAPAPILSSSQAAVISSTQTPSDGQSEPTKKALEPVKAPSSLGQEEPASLNNSGWSGLQTTAQRIIGTAFRLAAKVDVEGLENIPRAGPLLIAINHLSLFDPPLFFTLLPRRTFFLAKAELERRLLIRWFLNPNAIYLRRGEADQEALNRALAVLRAGGALGLAPEGTRSRSGGLAAGHTGLAYLAVETGAPILPMVAYGQELLSRNLKRLRRGQIHIRVGSLFKLPSGEKTAEKLRQDTQQVMTRLAELLPVAYRGAYASLTAPSSGEAQIALAAGQSSTDGMHRSER